MRVLEVHFFGYAAATFFETKSLQCPLMTKGPLLQPCETSFLYDGHFMLMWVHLSL
jgi:hypothetical protein